MFTQSEYVAIQMNHDARDNAFREAENLRKLHQAGLIRPGRISKAARFGVVRLGRLMVAIGQRLVKADAPANPSYSSLGRA